MGAAEVHSRPAHLRSALANGARRLCVHSAARARPPAGSNPDAGPGAGPALRHREEAMTLVSFSLILVGVLLNAAAQLLLKAGTNALPLGLRLAIEPHILAGLACYVVSVVVWIVALSRVPVSIAYPMLSIGYVVNAIAAWYLLGEAVTPMRLVGIGIIVLRVFILAPSWPINRPSPAPPLPGETPPGAPAARA